MSQPTLKDRINDALKTAMRAKEKERVAVLLEKGAVAISQQFEVKINQDATAIGKQLADAVLPTMHKAVQDLKVALRAEMTNARVTSKANANAAP